MGELGQNVRILCRITQVIKFWKAVIAWPARVIKEDLGSRWAREISFIMTPLSTAVSTAHTSYSSSILLQVSLWAGCDSQRFMFRDQIPEELVNCVWIGRSTHRSGILSLLYSSQLFLGIWPWKMSCTLSERWWAPCVWGHSSRVSENMAGRFWQHVLPWGWVGWTCRQAPWEGQIPPFPVALGGQEESWGEGSRGRYWPWTTERGAGCREPWDSGGVWGGSLATLLPLATHSIPSAFAGDAVRVERIPVPVGAAGNLHTRPRWERLLLVSSCLGPGPVPSPLPEARQPPPSRPPLRGLTKHPSYR